MMILYRCLLKEYDQLKQVLEAAQEIKVSYPLLEVSIADNALGAEARFSSGDAVVVLRVRKLSSEDRAALAPYGEFEDSVLFIVHEVTPESTGLCWDALIAISVYHPCTVWLNKRCYNEQAISRCAPVRPVQLGDNEVGFVMESEEFSDFVDE